MACCADALPAEGSARTPIRAKGSAPASQVAIAMHARDVIAIEHLHVVGLVGRITQRCFTALAVPARMHKQSACTQPLATKRSCNAS